MVLCSCLRFPQLGINNVVLSVRDVEVRTPLGRKTDAVEKICEFPKMGVEVVHAITCS